MTFGGVFDFFLSVDPDVELPGDDELVKAVTSASKTSLTKLTWSCSRPDLVPDLSLPAVTSNWPSITDDSLCCLLAPPGVLDLLLGAGRGGAEDVSGIGCWLCRYRIFS